MTNTTPHLDYVNALDRYKFLTIMNAANECEETQFVKQACMLWLVNYPSDLFVQYQQALNYAKLGKTDQAQGILESLIAFDPQFIEATQSLAELSEDAQRSSDLCAIHSYLTQETVPTEPPSAWLQPLWEARQTFVAGELEKAISLIHTSLLHEPTSPLTAILHLKAAYKQENRDLLNNLSEIYHQQWPDCLQINIIKSLADLDRGEESPAVERLHWVAAHDSAGQVIHRLLGHQHRFHNLWPDHLEIYFDLPIPATVSSALGWNQLDSGESAAPELTDYKEEKVGQPETFKPVLEEPLVPDQERIAKDQLDAYAALEELQETLSPESPAPEEDFEDIQRAFSRLAKRYKTPELERADNRFPVYVLLTSKDHLEKQYGPNTASVIADLLDELVSLIRQLPEWGARVYMPDDPALMSQLGIKPIIASDAWKIKLSLADLDAALAKQGEMIGALLIVGGPEIIPFHHLPNPTLDDDLDVPSDNPYSAVDKNYFIPQWPLGRLPGETGSDAGLLLHQIRTLIYQYGQRTKKGFLPVVTLNSLMGWFRQIFTNSNVMMKKSHSLGYSAEVWRDASAGVYDIVGRAKDLDLSPPTDSANIVLKNGHRPEIGYFNLHGIKDGPHWYGQKDFSSNAAGPDYPIALSPNLFNEKTPSPKLIVSEACYGANINNKQHEDALSLKFLDSGTQAFIGSTCIAYGAITQPLIAADYLAQLFWKQVLEGDSFGYALMRAKLTLAQEMARVQGFLDGEDQKTLLSFVLFGDPLGLYQGRKNGQKPLIRAKSHPNIKTLSDSDLEPAVDGVPIPQAVNKTLTQVVEKYLPGLHNAQIKVNTSTGSSENGKRKAIRDDRYYVTLSKTITENQDTTHRHFARLTFDKKGKLVKLSTSR